MSPKVGAPAPWFVVHTRMSPAFHFSSAGGRYVLLALMPDEGQARAEAMVALLRHRAQFDDQRISAFAVVRDAAVFAGTADQLPGLRWLLDPPGEVARLYGAQDDDGATLARWVLIDPMLRILEIAPIQDAAGIMARVAALGPAQAHAGAPMTAPVLTVPRIFEPQLCRDLIGHYEARGGAPSGVMRERDGMTAPVMDASKSRRDLHIENPVLRAEILWRIRERLLPEIRKAFQYQVTRTERHLVACYDSAEGGFFRAHRDDTTRATAHRRFACSINLNAEAFEGGDLVFPEFGTRAYRPPTGGAVVFSCTLLHEATPVTRGRRYAFLPFFYDEAGEAQRQANEAYLAPSLDSAQTAMVRGQ